MDSDREAKWSKKNSKLESFLKRALPRKIFEGIRYYESCIVRSAAGALGVKYLILTDQALYFTENPPRTIQEAIKFRDVKRIDLIHEYPEFLRGNDRENSQHICVHYETPDVLVSLPVPETVPETASSKVADSTAVAALLPLAAMGWTTQQKQTVSTISHPEEPMVSGKSPESDRKGHPPRSSSVLGAMLGKLGRSGSSRSLDTDHQMSKSKTEEEVKPLLDRLEEDSELILRIPRSLSVLEKPQAKKKVPQRPYSAMAVPVKKEIKLAPIELYKGGLKALMQSTLLPLQPYKEVHIYVVLRDSPTFTYLHNTWNCCLLSSTLSLERNTPAPTLGDASPHQLQLIYEQFLEDLHDPNNNMEQTFDLLVELYQGTERNYALKGIFWKDQTVYHYLLRLFQKQLPTTAPTSRVSQEKILTTTEDQLEMMVLILDTLRIMLTDTDALMPKLQMMKYNRGTLVQHLLSLLFVMPEIPMPFRNTCQHMLDDYHEFVSTAWENLPEAETIKLLAEVINSSMSVVYEVLLMVIKLTQEKACPSISKMMNGIKWDRFLHCTTMQLLSFLYPAKARSLTPSQAVLVYQHLFVLRTLMQSSGAVLEFIRTNFQEEFRYYLQRTVVSPKIPDSYPIKSKVMQLIDENAKLILRKNAHSGRSQRNN